MTALTRRTALVTGDTGRLGAAVTSGLLAEGWRVVVPWRAGDDRELLPEHPDLVLVRADLADETPLGDLMATATADPSSPLFGVVNLIGGFTFDSHGDPGTVRDSQLNVDLRTTYAVIQAALIPLIQGGGGSVVCVSAAAVHHPYAESTTHIVSKAAVVALVEALAPEYFDDRIRINALVPLVIEAPGRRGTTAPTDPTDDTEVSRTASVIEFLLSDSSSAITGGSIPVVHPR